MTEDLKRYLDKSKEGRQKLTKIANNIKQAFLCEHHPDQEISVFPSPNAARFHQFKETLSLDLQKIFKPPELTLKPAKQNRSVSLRKGPIFSVYGHPNPTQKRVFILPPIFHTKQSSLLERILGSKCVPMGLSTSVNNTLTKSTVKSTNTRFEVKQQLLKPILKKNI